MNSLPKTVIGQRHSCNLNPGPSAPESSTLTAWQPSHSMGGRVKFTYNQICDSLLIQQPKALRSVTKSNRQNRFKMAPFYATWRMRSFDHRMLQQNFHQLFSKDKKAVTQEISRHNLLSILMLAARIFIICEISKAYSRSSHKNKFHPHGNSTAPAVFLQHLSPFPFARIFCGIPAVAIPLQTSSADHTDIPIITVELTVATQ